jgi:hypothetical protein
VIKSRRKRAVWHETPMKEKREDYKALIGRLEEKTPFGRQTHRRENKPNIEIELQKHGGRVWTAFTWLRTGTVKIFGFHKVLGLS